MDARRFALVILAGALAGCGAAKPVPYHSAQEIPQGPGMLSGTDGTFIFRVGGGEQAKAVTSTQRPAAPGSKEEFEAFREYQRWKESSGSSADKREFQDWRQWQEWQEWRRQR